VQVERCVSYWTSNAQVTWYFKATKIGHLELRDNNFSGNIPDWIESLSFLEYLDLGENEFSGELLVKICDLVNLADLRISDNLIEGTYDSLLFFIQRLYSRMHR
jgi:Leucine-rich repeat (LRR) protein